MDAEITLQQLCDAGMTRADAEAMIERMKAIPAGADADPARRWSIVSRTLLRPDVPFPVHLLLYDAVFSSWDPARGPRPAWTPTAEEIGATAIDRACRSLGLHDYAAFHRWSVTERAAFWGFVVDTIGVPFQTPPEEVVDLSAGVESPRWLPGAVMNAASCCFLSPSDATAIVYQRAGDRRAGDAPLETMTIAELDALTNRVASGLGAAGVAAGDAVAIAMPMTVEAVAAYIGIVKAGCVVVSIADSFAPQEIATRLRISGAVAVVTQDVVHRAGKTLPMYAKVVAAGARTCVVVPAGESPAVELRASDRTWDAFIAEGEASWEVPGCDPGATCNVLFSSGTTGDPKAIPWSHTTAIKCAMDGAFHHDIHEGDVVAWPTNIGWMMGPWLIFAALANRGVVALYYGAPNTPAFCRFVQDARVTMLGVVPSLVRAWRNGGMVDGLDWSSIKCFSSTGEASNTEDMLWLMSRAGYRPVVEYCGGTEIGGGYITQTLVQAASPATFSTPALGLDFHILDEDGARTDNGELFLVPPSIGLSVTLLNRDHHEVYYEGTPAGPGGETLRRHGDQVQRLPGGYFRAHGRADDTMNLGGIKVSSAEIERTVNALDGVLETAAIASDPRGGGPSRLVIYAVREADANLDPVALKAAMQKAISSKLNPLFRVHDVVVVEALPRTASNKVMRRVLRDQYKD